MGLSGALVQEFIGFYFRVVMEQTAESQPSHHVWLFLSRMELVDDVWHRVFGLLPSIQVPKFALVCKKWRDLVMHPLVWQTLEVSLAKNANSRDNERISEEDHEKAKIDSTQIASLARTTNFFQFLHKISSSIVDLNIEVELPNTKEEMSSTLDAIFQIPSLQRFKCKFVHFKKNVTLGGIARATISARNNEYYSTAVPACKNLKLLNLPESGVFVYPKTYQTLLSGLPNLEEFYVGSGMPIDPDWFLNTPKLQRLSLCSYGYVSDVHKIIEACPSLQYVILRDEACLDESDLPLLTNVDGCSLLKRYKNTYIVFATIFNNLSIRSKQHLDILKPLFTPYIVNGGSYLSCLVAQNGMTSLKPLLQFFINEMHYDINARDIPEFYYRPSFYYKQEIKTVPIEEAVRDHAKLKLLIDMGATIEIPEGSLLTRAENVDVALTLLQHGADPNRMVDDKYPAYVQLLLTLSRKKIHLLVQELCKRGCDLNHPRLSHIYKGHSLLDEQILAKNWQSVEALLDYGMKWQWSKYATEFGFKRHERLLEFLEKGKIDIASMPILLAVFLCRYGAASLLIECFKANRDYRVTDGITLSHLIALIPPQPKTEALPPATTYKSLTKFDRWIDISPKPFQVLPYSSSTTGFSFSNDGDDPKSLFSFSPSPSTQPLLKLSKTPANPSTTFGSKTNTTVPKASSAFSFKSKIPPPNPRTLFNQNATATLNTTKRFSFNSTETSTAFNFNNSAQSNNTPAPNFSFNNATPINSAPSEPQTDVPKFSFTSSIPPPSSNTAFFFNAVTPSNTTSPALPSLPPINLPNISAAFGVQPQQTPSVPTFSFSSQNVGTENQDGNITSTLTETKKYDWASDFVEIFVKQINTDLNAVDDKGNTPLHILMKAQLGGFIKMQRAALMIEHGADPLAKNNEHVSILSMACLCGAWEVGYLLLDKYNANINDQDIYGITPLMHAIYGFKHNDVEPQHEFDVNFSRVLTKYSIDYSLRDELGRSLVHFLASLGERELLLPYLDKMDVNARDESGFTPLHYAIMFGHDHLIEPLISHGADVNAQTTSLKLTPLMLLVHITNTTSPYKSYLYHYATAFFGSFAGKKSPKPAQTNMSRARPFTTRLRRVPDTVELLRSKSDLSLTDRFDISVQQLLDGKTNEPPLMLSDTLIVFLKLLRNTHERSDWLTQLQAYLDKKDDTVIHSRDENGNTPLHIACQFFHLGAIDSMFASLEDEHQSAPYCLVAFMLLERGADPTLKNNKGETPLDYVPNLKELSNKMYKRVLEATKERIEHDAKLFGQATDFNLIGDIKTL